MFAYPNTIGYIYISISIHDNKNLDIEVRDFGCGIEDVNKAKSPRFSTEETSGGMGFFLMEAFSNKMSVESIPKKGTVVTLSFEIF